MLLAIDVGNTNTVVGVWTGSEWLSLWRRRTDPEETEDQLAVWLKGLFDLSGIPWKVESAICASVVPAMDGILDKLCERYLNVRLRFLRTGANVGMNVTYNPPHAVGADRIANALGALDKYPPPIIVVDFGTATTFDSIDKDGAYVGGAILPGVGISSQALFDRAAKLPQVEFRAPETALGRDTVHSLQSGIMFGYAGAIDALASRISSELGGAKIIATGGLGSLFLGLCESIEALEPTLTMDGLRIASDRLSATA
ncbi:MAG: type III pantothenate kinase [Fimbriimonas sp.]